MQKSEETKKRDNTKEQSNKEDLISDFQLSTKWFETVSSFEEIGLCKDLLKGIYSVGFERPSDLQKKGFSAIKMGKDTLIQDQKSHGKASMLAISALEAIDVSILETQVILITGTKELAQQRIDLIQQFNVFLKVSVNDICNSIETDQQEIDKGKHIFVETPDRVLDILSKKFLGSSQPDSFLKLIIFDKLDDLLSKGFNYQVTNIFQLLPVEIQVVITTNTSSSSSCIIELKNIINKFLKHPEIILSYSPELTLDGVHQYYIDIQEQQYKLETILELFQFCVPKSAIIYCSSQESCENLIKQLQEQKMDVEGIHGDTIPAERNEILMRFTTGQLQYLILTDNCLRCIDSSQVILTIHYDIPKDIEFYIKRIGRTGCYGRRNNSISLLLPSELSWIKEIEQYYATRIEELPININDIM